MTIATSEPAVPGAIGEYPAPKHVASSIASLVFIFGLGPRTGRRRNHKLLRCPRAQVEQPAALAAKREIRSADLHFHLLAGRTLDHTASWMSGPGAKRGAVSVGASSVPPTS